MRYKLSKSEKWNPDTLYCTYVNCTNNKYISKLFSDIRISISNPFWINNDLNLCKFFHLISHNTFCNTTKNLLMLQGDPNQSFPFQMAVTQKLSSSDSMLVKPKCVWEVAVFFWKIVNKQLKNVNKFSKIEKNCRHSNSFWHYQHGVRRS